MSDPKASSEYLSLKSDYEEECRLRKEAQSDHAMALDLILQIREAVGDPEGKLMQDQLVERVRTAFREREKWKREHRAMSKGAQTNAKVVELQAKKIAELREDKERLGSGCIEIYRQVHDRLNHAEELLDELSSGFWVDVMDRHVEGMGQKVLEYWKKQGGRDE